MLPHGLINRSRICFSYLNRRAVSQGFPLELQLGITNRCNLDCIFCPQSRSPRPRGVMPLELLKELVGQAAPFVDLIDLSYDGEPFLHPQWARCVEICRIVGVGAQFETNCLLLDEEHSREVLASGLTAITLSIDAAREETYYRLKPSGNFDRVIRNAERFLAMSRTASARPYIQVQFVTTPQNRAEVPEFMAYWEGKGADAIRIKPMLNFGGSVGEKGAIQPASRPCLFLWTSMAVSWDGTVPLCCLEIEGRTNMGNANTSSLKQIFRGEKFNRVRLLHATGRYREHPVCRDCWVPSVAWPFVLGSALVGDLTRRRAINLMNRVSRYVKSLN